MQSSVHRFSELFAQLGLASSPAAIQQFLLTHAPLPDGVALPDAPFWSSAQAGFLHEALLEDSDWAELADQLSEALRAPKA
jgi:hypothetical protein